MQAQFLIPLTTVWGDINTPVQIHHGDKDASVPEVFESLFANLLQRNGLFIYESADHNISGSFACMQRTIAFFDKYLKN
jgi:fermentation-respiration switch protein FrsA (DUF1100 family)